MRWGCQRNNQRSPKTLLFVFRRFACRPAAFRSVWDGEPEKLLIRVSDTGCGIPEVYQRSIFQPFFRVDKSRSREYGGAGLGLSLVWEIADLHGGSVWVEKSSEKGTTIAVELPTQQSTKP